MSEIEKKAFLIILDGYGLRDQRADNAVKLANTPFLHEIVNSDPSTMLSASGSDVGLPTGQMGNSEVGHLNLGAGRIVYQDITRINNAIANNEFQSNPVIQESIKHAVHNDSSWHLIGLVSDGGVHSSLNHLYALLETASLLGCHNVFLHAFTDGRDTPPHSAIEFIHQVEAEMKRIGVGKIATVCGRYWGMDRDKRWERLQRAYKMLIAGEGLRYPRAENAVLNSYDNKITDEFIEPSVITENSSPIATIKENDSVFFFNFRADRAREISLALTDSKFEFFKSEKLKIHYSTLTRYREDFSFPVAFPPVHLNNILGEVISKAGLKQFRIAETEKYAHVTFFFNGGEEIPFPGETRLLVPSPKVATYDLQPEMSAPEVAEQALQALSDNYSFILLNFANPDMVGHTGILEAVISALETLNPLIEILVEKAQSQGYTTLITADHGNCEMMKDHNGEPHTAHTTNPVNLTVIAPGKQPLPLRSGGILADVAPTILDILGLLKPDEMTGRSLLV